MGMDVSSGSYGNLHPRIAADASGNPMVIWGNLMDESVYFSKWNGVSFSQPVKLNPSWLTIATASWMGPDIAAKGDTVYVVMKQTPETDTSSHLYIISSFDGGMSFSPPVQIDNIGDSLSRFPAVTIDATGNPVTGFMKFDNSFQDSRWAVTKSFDYGNTFKPDTRASGWSGPNALVCDCCPGAMVSENNIVAMLYRDNLDNIRDIWAGISTDGGNTFDQGLAVDQSEWNLFACPSSGPDGVIKGDTLFTVYMSGASGDDLVYLSKSSLPDLQGAPGIPITGSFSGLDLQNYPRIDKSGNAMAIVWKQNVSGEDQLPVLFTNDISNGFPLTYDTVDLDDVTNADVSVSNGNIFIVWQDDNSGTVKYSSGIYEVSTSVHTIDNNSSLFIYPNPASMDGITVRLPPSFDGIITYNVLNIFGKILLTRQVEIEKGSIRINLSPFETGTFYLKINSGDQYPVSKIIKQ